MVAHDEGPRASCGGKLELPLPVQAADRARCHRNGAPKRSPDATSASGFRFFFPFPTARVG